MNEARQQGFVERLAEVRAELAVAAGGQAVELVAVSKTVEVTGLQAALDAGQRVFGENYVQEAGRKWPTLREAYPEVRLHLIGHLQRNKAVTAVQLFDRIDTLDRVALVPVLKAAMDKVGREVPLLIEVNQGGEAQKSGCAVEEVPKLLRVAREAGLQVQGLMTVPPVGVEVAPYFRALGLLADELGLPVRSMGMSADFALAAQCGATEVRVGSRLFGARVVREVQET